MRSSVVTSGFIAAGAANVIAVLALSRGLSNRVINDVDPIVMSNFGLVMIIVWGFAYFSVARAYYRVRWLVLVFAIEKAIYGIIWLVWIKHNAGNLADIYERDFFAGIFYSTYGANDLIFMLFFAIVFFTLVNNPDSSRRSSIG